MARSLKKGPYIDPNLQKKISKLNAENKKGTIKTWARNSTITPEFIGHTLLVHNGKEFIKLFISEDLVGHKPGEFAPTRKYPNHTTKNKK